MQRFDKGLFMPWLGNPYLIPVSQTNWNPFFVFAIFLELLEIICVIILVYLMRWVDPPLMPFAWRNFTCNDPTISKDTLSFNPLWDFSHSGIVKTEVFWSFCFIIPIMMIIVGEVIILVFGNRSYEDTGFQLQHESPKMPMTIRRIFRFLGVFIFGAFSTIILTDTIKLFTAWKAPNFVERCQLTIDCTQYWGISLDESLCSVDVHTLREISMNFPSVYSSVSAFCSIFACIYVHGVLQSRYLHILRPLIIFTVLILGWLISLVRLARWYDWWYSVIWGYILGTLMAVYLGYLVLHGFTETRSNETLVRAFKAFMESLSNEDRLGFYEGAESPVRNRPAVVTGSLPHLNGYVNRDTTTYQRNPKTPKRFSSFRNGKRFDFDRRASRRYHSSRSSRLNDPVPPVPREVFRPTMQ